MAKFEIYEQVNFSLFSHQYSVAIGFNALFDEQFWRSLVTSQQVLIVTSNHIAPLYLHYLKSVFKDKQCDCVLLPDGEEHKNHDSVLRIYEMLIVKKHNRDTTLIALGGGVIGDMTGFAASTYQRGVRYLQIPTTLLAQVDASIGGKTAINHPLGKNLIGSFYQPNAVIIDVNTLNTLPEREFNAGLAEVIKYSLLAGGSFFSSLYVLLRNGISVQTPELPQIISQCCRIKTDFVVNDEKEQGVRALLNLGHTFAHALEAYTHYRLWLHGEAVAIGLYCAALLSYELRLIKYTLVESIEQMLLWAKLPHKIPSTVSIDELMQLMRLDKKVKNGQLRFILIRKPGDCYVHEKINELYVKNALIAAVEGEKKK